MEFLITQQVLTFTVQIDETELEVLVQLIPRTECSLAPVARVICHDL